MAQTAEQKNRIESLKELLPEEKTVYTRVDHVSRSGTTREISLFITKDNEMLNISWDVAKACGYKLGKNGGVKISGCNMDMGFAIVYNLGRTLYPNGSEKGTVIGRNGDTEPETDGGYLLKQRWI